LPGDCGSIEWGDYDNDGDMDLVVVGTYTGSPVAKIFRNEGGGSFVEETNAIFTGVGTHDVKWGDYDNDGKLDLVFVGSTTMVYHNEGNGLFALETNTIFPRGGESVAWADYDSDGHLDLTITGDDDAGRFTRIYHNDGGGIFTENASASIVALKHSALAWGDYDNDGDLDLLLAGEISDGTTLDFRCFLYRNEGNGQFQEIDAGFGGVDECSVAWGDYDRDGRLDLVIVGQQLQEPRYISRVYRNNCEKANTVPTVPGGLTANVVSNDVTLSWNPGTDAETPVEGLSYNIRVRTDSVGEEDIVPSMSAWFIGTRRIPAMGNVQLNKSWTIKGLAPGTYHWTVQSVDNCYAGSYWATEQTFVVP